MTDADQGRSFRDPVRAVEWKLNRYAVGHLFGDDDWPAGSIVRVEGHVPITPSFYGVRLGLLARIRGGGFEVHDAFGNCVQRILGPRRDDQFARVLSADGAREVVSISASGGTGGRHTYELSCGGAPIGTMRAGMTGIADPFGKVVVHIKLVGLGLRSNRYELETMGMECSEAVWSAALVGALCRRLNRRSGGGG
jgi:hypothetical protein